MYYNDIVIVTPKVLCVYSACAMHCIHEEACAALKV